MTHPETTLGHHLISTVHGELDTRTLDLLDDFVFIHRFDGQTAEFERFIFVNLATCQAFGWTRLEFASLTPADLLPEATLSEGSPEVERILERSHLVFQKTMCMKNGGRIPLQLSTRVLETESGPIALTVGRDLRITDPIQAAAEQDRSMLSGTLDAVAVEIALLASDGTILHVNRPWKRFALHNGGRLERVGPGANYFDACAVDAEARPVVRGLEAVRDGLEERFVHEYLCATPRGDLRFRMTVSPVPGEPPRGLVVVHDDVTSARAAEAVLLKEGRSRSALLRRDRELVESERRETVARLESDIGQGLAALHIDLTDLSTRLDPGTPAHETTLRAIGVAGHLLDTTQSLQSRLHPPMLDILGLLPTLDWFAESVTRDSGIEVEWDVDPSARQQPLEPRCALGLYRVAQEALRNVIRHARAGRVRIGFRMRPETELTIEDDGVGIPAESGGAQPRLGLLAMKERVTELGGSLSIDRSELGGARVRATLPPSQEGG